VQLCDIMTTYAAYGVNTSDPFQVRPSIRPSCCLPSVCRRRIQPAPFFETTHLHCPQQGVPPPSCFHDTKFLFNVVYTLKPLSFSVSSDATPSSSASNFSDFVYCNEIVSLYPTTAANRVSINFVICCTLTWRWLSCGLWRRVDWYEFTNASEFCIASINALTMEAVQTSETLVNLYQSTRHYNP
jgi:hypothetical protein